MRARTVVFTWVWAILAAVLAYAVVRLRAPIPEGPEKALDVVCSSLVKAARAKGLAGTAREIVEIRGPQGSPFFDSLVPLLNARLEPGFDRFVASDELRKRVVAEAATLLKDPEWVQATPNLTRKAPETLLFAQWAWSDPPRAATLTLRAVRLSATADGVQASVLVTPPEYRERKHQQRNRWLLILLIVAAPLAAIPLWAIGAVIGRRPDA